MRAFSSAEAPTRPPGLLVLSLHARDHPTSRLPRIVGVAYADTLLRSPPSGRRVPTAGTSATACRKPLGWFGGDARPPCSPPPFALRGRPPGGDPSRAPRCSRPAGAGQAGPKRKGSRRVIGRNWRGFFGAHRACGLQFTHQEHKKSADLHQAAESSVEIFRSRDRSPAHRPLWVKAPCRLQRQVAGFGFPNRS
jgi:hypothetical protein